MAALTTTNQPAPLFRLPGLDGQLHDLVEQRGRIMILNFWSAECPWSGRADQVLLAGLQRWGASVALWDIAANANEPEEFIRRAAGERCLPLVLLDCQRQVADLYGAQNTPHLFVIDGAGVLRYQGALDDMTFRRRTPTRSYLVEAVEALLQGRLPDPQETPSYGCTIVRHA